MFSSVYNFGIFKTKLTKSYICLFWSSFRRNLIEAPVRWHPLDGTRKEAPIRRHMSLGSTGKEAANRRHL